MTVASQATFVDRIESLPPLPAVVNRIMEVTESPNASAGDVARVLSDDQAVAAKILRVANSSYYGSGRQVTQVSRAVVMLGNVGVRNLVLGITARDAISTTAQVPEHSILWGHSIAVASTALAIARQVGLKPPEEAFTAGLLHDIGQLAMVTFEPDSFRSVFEEQGHGIGFLAIERNHFGVDHTEAGSRILSRWGIPEAICKVVLQHHQQEIDPSESSSRLQAVIMLADTIVQMMGYGFDIPVGKPKRAEAASQLLKLHAYDQLRIIDGLNDRIAQAVDMFESVDSAKNHRESASFKRAIWVPSGDKDDICISQLLLEHYGYEVCRRSASDIAAEISQDDVVFLAPSEGYNAAELASDLVQRGHGRTVLLCESADGAAPRQLDAKTGVCCLPHLFTVFDLHWVEEQLRA